MELHLSASIHIALLRGINVGGHNKVPMADLRSLCSELGFGGVLTYIQSGNIILQSDLVRTEIEPKLEQGIVARFGPAIAVIVRSAGEWDVFTGGHPFDDLSAADANRVMLALSKAQPREDAAEKLAERATTGERVVRKRDAIWIHFPAGAGTSRISPGLMERLVGSPVTMRNWRTVVKLGELSRQAGGEAGPHAA